MAEALPSLEVALAVDAVAADEGAVLPICPIPALGFTPGRDEGKQLEHPWHLGTSSIPPHAWRQACISLWWLVASEARRGVQAWTEPTAMAMELEGACETLALCPLDPGCLQWGSALKLGCSPANSSAQDWFQGCRTLQ